MYSLRSWGLCPSDCCCSFLNVCFRDVWSVFFWFLLLHSVWLFLVVALMLLRFYFCIFCCVCSVPVIFVVLLFVCFSMFLAVFFVIFLMLSVVLVLFVDSHVFDCLSLVVVNLAKYSRLESLPQKGLECKNQNNESLELFLATTENRGNV